MKLTRRELFGTVLAVPFAAKLRLAGKSAPTWRWFAVEMTQPPKLLWGSQRHRELVTYPAIAAIWNIVLAEAKGRPVYFQPLELPRAVEFTRAYTIGPMKCRETWVWDFLTGKIWGRMDALVRIG